MTCVLCGATVTDWSVAPLAYSPEHLVLIARSRYTDAEANVVTELLAIDAHNHSIIGAVGHPMLNVSWITAKFVKDSWTLVAVYSSSTEHPGKEGTAVCLYQRQSSK